MTRARFLLAACAAALLAIAVGSAYWMTATARTAMSRQVIAGERTAAAERAAQIADAADVARQRLSSTAALPGAVAAVTSRDTTMAALALRRATDGGALIRVAITVGDGVIARSPEFRPAVVVPDDAVHIETIGLRDAGMLVRAPIRGDGGETLGMVHEEVSLRSLVPHLTQPIAGGHDIGTLVTTDGRVLVTASSHPTARLSSASLREAVARQTTTGLRYHADDVHADRIAAVAPVPGHPWAVVIETNASAAYAPAGALVTRLLLGFAVIAALAGLVLAAAALVVRAGRNQLWRLHQRSLHEATTDPLTGVGNRRAFDQRLTALRASSVDVGVVIVDIDDLKSINDTNGHAMGDFVIRRVSDAIRSAVRSHDAVFRIGGDEFAVIVPDLSLDDAHVLSARIVARVGAERLDAGRALRASVGAAAGAGRSIDDVLHQADTAMYRVKRQGAAVV